MKTYEYLGGGKVMAASNQQLAEEMRNSSFSPGDSLEEYMRETAAACKIQRGSDIRFDSVDNFINDLISNGFLTQV